ncbi:MAG TPA: GH116 family glycosyl-hydrolase, partial [Clostridiales bacterium]|nr:GH116 family glycosyl-hydrolase [Clostridiales bacterium]
MKTKQGFRYEGEFSREISFPLGGIGAGCVGLAGNGRLVDFEIFNRPNKNSVNGFTHFAVKAEKGGEVLDARVLHGDLMAPYSGAANTDGFGGFGFGVNRSTMAGLPHFERCSFTAAYPFARVDFQDRRFPGEVALEAFSPLIPLNDKDSSIPAAFFEIAFFNPTGSEITYTAAFSLTNPRGTAPVAVSRKNGVCYMFLDDEGNARSSPDYGNLCTAADSNGATVQAHWLQGSWFDSLSTFWREFASPGSLPEREYDEPAGGNATSTLSVRLQAAPGGSVKARFVLAWSFPNCVNYWNPAGKNGDPNAANGWRNYYATVFKDA